MSPKVIIQSVAETEVPFADGNVSGTVRVGETVRRQTGPWTPAIHALLHHLDEVGFDPAPKVLGFDAHGREALSFLPGETVPATLQGFESDEVLVDAARMLREYHDAVRDFKTPPDAGWRVTVGAPTEGEIVCHNDFAPWNLTFVNGRPTGLIDWDFAAPGPVTWDIAYALWRFVPLYPDNRYGSVNGRVRRIRIFADAYGLDDRRGLTDHIASRQRVLYDTLSTWGQAGVPAFAEMWRDGHGDIVQRDMNYFQKHRSEFAAMEW